MRHESGMSKGFGFVCFSSPEEAMSALHGLNGETKFSLPLFLCPHNLSCDFIRRFLRDILWLLMWICNFLGTFFEGRNLYVAVAQRKEDRSKVLQNYYVQNIPVQSSYQSSCSAVTPQFNPFYFNFPPCAPVFPLLRQPSLYQHFVANMGFQYPFATTHDQQNFSYVSMSLGFLRN